MKATKKRKAVKHSKKARRKGAGKGQAFERKTCKQLSLWVSGKQEEDLFWRNAISGGRATQSAKGGKLLPRQAGDICAISEAGHALTEVYFIECKHWRNLDLLAFILHDRGKLAGFWHKASQEAQKHGKKAMLIAKQNNVPTLLIMKPNELPCNPIAVCGTRCEIGWLDDLLAMKVGEVLS